MVRDSPIEAPMLILFASAPAGVSHPRVASEPSVKRRSGPGGRTAPSMVGTATSARTTTAAASSLWITLIHRQTLRVRRSPLCAGLSPRFGLGSLVLLDDQTETERGCDDLGASSRAEPAARLPYVGANRLHTEGEPGADLFVALSFREQ